MSAAYALLLGANLVYATSYVATRLVLDDLPPAFLALVRLAGGAAVLLPAARLLEGRGPRPGRGDAWRIAWMGVFGFAGAFALGNWGLAQSTATNAALLIIVEPVSIMLFGPLVLGSGSAAGRASAPRWRCSALLWWSSAACPGSPTPWPRAGGATSSSSCPASPTAPTR